MKCVALLLAAVVAVAAVHSAEAAPLPAPERLAKLDGELSSAYRVRIATPRGTVIVADARATEAGVEYRELVHSASTDTLRSPGSIGWAEIERIQTGGDQGSRWFTVRNATLIGVGSGVVTTLAAGWGWYLPIFTAAGFIAGVVAQRRAGRWHTVYSSAT